MKDVCNIVSLLFIILLWAESGMGQQASTPPTWAREAIWYQIFPEPLRNGDLTNDPLLDIPSWKITEWGSDYYKKDTWETFSGTIFQTIPERRYETSKAFWTNLTVGRKINSVFDIFRLTPTLFQFPASGFISSILLRFAAEECRICLFFRFSRKPFFVKASISLVISKAPQ